MLLEAVNQLVQTFMMALRRWNSPRQPPSHGASNELSNWRFDNPFGFLVIGRRRGLAGNADFFCDSDELDNGLGLHFAHHLSTMHFDRDFTASQRTCDLLIKQTRYD